MMGNHSRSTIFCEPANGISIYVASISSPIEGIMVKDEDIVAFRDEVAKDKSLFSN